MSDSEERDVVGRLIAEDVADAGQCLRLALRDMGYGRPYVAGEVEAHDLPIGDELINRKAFNELRQQLADVSNEWDLLRAGFDKKDQALRNMLGAFDAPIARRKITGEFPCLAIESAHEALDMPSAPSAEKKS